MTWAKVGQWLKNNAGEGAALVGALLTGNAAGAIAAGASLVASATGASEPAGVLARLQADPATVVRLQELALQEQQSLRAHLEAVLRAELEDKQHEHGQTQSTIRAGDASTDERIRMVRPTMAQQSWVATIGYCVGAFGVLAITGADVFDAYVAGFLSAPAWAYLGLRTVDKLQTRRP